MYAIDKGLVKSNSIDLRITYCTGGFFDSCPETAQFDVSESDPMTGAYRLLAGGSPQKDIIVSSGREPKSGPYVVVRRGFSRALTRNSLVGWAADCWRVCEVESKYVLTKKYGLQFKPRVTRLGSLALLSNGIFDAVVFDEAGAWSTIGSGHGNEQFDVLDNLAESYATLTGTNPPHTDFVVSEGFGATHAAQIRELQRMLQQSSAYLRENQADVLSAVAGDAGVSLDYLQWYFSSNDFPIGPLTTTQKKEFVSLWQSARELGMLPSTPKWADLAFK